MVAILAAILLGGPAFVPPSLGADQASAQDAWWSALGELCGRAYAGALASDDPRDADLAGEPMVMHVRVCEPDRIEIPFHVGDDRSRVWVLTRTAAGIELKHRHTHRDGSADLLTHYGGLTIEPGTESRQDFPADEYSRELFVANGIEQSASNVWSIEIVAGERYSYILRRPERYFRADFDLRRAIATPAPPWGSDEPAANER